MSEDLESNDSVATFVKKWWSDRPYPGEEFAVVPAWRGYHHVLVIAYPEHFGSASVVLGVDPRGEGGTAKYECTVPGVTSVCSVLEKLGYATNMGDPYLVADETTGGH